MADLKDGASKRHELKLDDDLRLLNSALFPRRSEKTVPFEMHFQTVKCLHTTLLFYLSSHVSSGETHLVVKLFTAVSSSNSS